jgi:hypothetical protein
VLVAESKENGLILGFIRMTFGLLLILSILVIYKTAAHTVFTGIIVVLTLIGVFWNVYNERISSKTYLHSVFNYAKKILIFGFIIGLFFSCAYALVYQVWRTDSIAVIHHDYTYYSQVSYYLVNQGIENRLGLMNEFREYQNIKIPYHYPDLWLIGIISSVTGISNIYVTHSLVPVLSICVLFFALLPLVLKKEDSSADYKKVVFLILLLPCTYFGIVSLVGKNPFFNSTHQLSIQSYWSFPKYFFLLPTYMMFCYFKRLTLPFYLLPILLWPFINIGSVPIGGLFVFFLTITEYKNSSRKQNLLNAGTTIAFGILSVGVFLYYRDESGQGKMNNISKVTNLFSFQYVILLFKIFFKSLIDIFLVTIPFIVLIIASKNYTVKSFIRTHYAEFLLLLAGLISYLMFNHVTREAYQFFYLPFFGIFPLFFILATYKCIEDFSGYKWFLLVSIFCFHSLWSFFASCNSFLGKNRIAVNELAILKAKFSDNGILHKPGAFFVKEDKARVRINGFQVYNPTAMLFPGVSGHNSVYREYKPEKGLWTDIQEYQTWTPYYKYCSQVLNEMPDNSPKQVIGYLKHFDVEWIAINDSYYMPEFLKPYVCDTWNDTSNDFKLCRICL